MKGNLSEQNESKFDLQTILARAGSGFTADVVKSILIFVVGGIAGAIIIAARIDPRVIALEVAQAQQDSVNGSLADTVESVRQTSLENRIKVEMLILYQIPASEREKLRQEAELQVETEQDQNTSVE